MARTWTVPATVLRIVDGDTVELLLDLGWRISLTANCRILGINAPELATRPGKLARAYAVQLLTVGATCIFHSQQLDKYGRPLGSITMENGEDFGAKMLEGGHAVPLDYH